MALTQQQAAQAGVIAAQITALQTALAAAQAALNAGMIVTSHGLNLINPNGNKSQAVSSSYQLGSGDSAAILTTLIAAYQSSIASLNQQLAGM